ncbi:MULTISPECIES: hypothetical protein [Pseudomonas]|uniref:hypothetical protein n=1 Tax=Pseudomonas TaxID=286 RepID=UPI00168B7644|nr:MULTISPECIES: hypothetical protein [Pseudomonas putida group]MDN5673879.1 hypothetical protein [Pseudomonas sp.]QNL86136.1 Uncharacterized protein PPKH_0722 [Pseudomonas putida]
MKKATIPEEKRSQSQGDITTSASPAQLLETAPTKIARVLVYVRHFGTLNRFEAPRWVGDTCLNSTIPVLESSYGLVFEHIPEKSPNNWGEPCDCTRYRLLESSHEHADKVLALMFNRAAKRQKVAA